MVERKGILRWQVVPLISCALGCKRDLSFVSFAVPTADDPSRYELLVLSFSASVPFSDAIDFGGSGRR